VLASGALKLEGNLLGSLCLLAEDGLGLATEALLLSVVAALTLSGRGVTALLVLRDLVRHVLLALRAVCFFLFRSVHPESPPPGGRVEHPSASLLQPG